MSRRSRAINSFLIIKRREPSRDRDALNSVDNQLISIGLSARKKVKDLRIVDRKIKRNTQSKQKKVAAAIYGRTLFKASLVRGKSS